MSDDNSKLRTYIRATLTLLVTELKAVFNKTEGDTITEYTKSNPISWAAMGGLLVWAVYHFIIGEFTGFTDAGNILALVSGVIAGVAAWLFRKKKEE